MAARKHSSRSSDGGYQEALGDVPNGDIAHQGVTSDRGQDPVGHVRQWLAERGVDVNDEGGEKPVGDRHLFTADGSDVAPSRRASRTSGDGAASPAAMGPVAASGADRDRGPDADPESVARAIVLRKLAAQARTRAELRKALDSKQVPASAAAAVLDRMEAVGLVDDEEFARDWVQSRQQRRHLSRLALRRELTAKGVDRGQIDTALEHVDADDELEAARSLAGKKARSMAGLDPQVRYRRLAAMLGRRGFSSGVISQVTAEAARQATP